eukprot:CAMPEP_0119515734 /NCGR_PEP_ID=MMETSP1344-20130328/33140_1 /TAXON_ID=236787 /ORGANISM="Florenciella parvula, Strain CCMP2471" /LENGTH=41 /DNA_ID= /DNA_START= /DNA_END= /DNA_ORIENTATION=
MAHRPRLRRPASSLAAPHRTARSASDAAPPLSSSSAGHPPR